MKDNRNTYRKAGHGWRLCRWLRKFRRDLRKLEAA
jgi:hypothetical protein